MTSIVHAIGWRKRSRVVGYDWERQETWLRTSWVLPHGKEYHALVYCTKYGDFRGDPEIMRRMREHHDWLFDTEIRRDFYVHRI